MLLPTSTSKLLAQWQGPYEVVKPIGEVDYLINMHDRRNKRRVFHVNMLKQFHSPTVVDSSFLVDDTVEASVERELSDEILSWNSQQIGQPNNKVTCRSYWMSLQMCYSLSQAKQQ